MSDVDVAVVDRVLSAAIDLLDAGGEAAVRVNAVAATSGVGRPSVYDHFGDREGLIVAAQAERYRQTLMFGMAGQYGVMRSVDSREEFFEQIRRWMTMLGGDDGVRRRRVRAQILGSAVTRPKLRKLIQAADREAARRLALVIAVAQDRGWTTHRFDPEVAALWWYGLMNGRFLVEGDDSDSDRAAWDDIATEAVVRLFGDTPRHIASSDAL